jgi:ribose transport system permease protein
MRCRRDGPWRRSCTFSLMRIKSAADPWLSVLQRYQGLVGLLLLLIVAFFTEPAFFKPANLQNVLNQVAIPGVMGIGMTFVILTGGIDLSVGSLLGLLTCIAATWAKDGAPLGPTSAYVLLLGTAIGALLGLIISVTRLQPFVVTLAAMVSLRGIAHVYTNNANVSGVGETFKPLQQTVAGLPLPAWLFVLITGVAIVVLHKTTSGRYLYALGGNEEASRYAGLPVTRIRTLAYAVNGLCVAIAALLYTSRVNGGAPSAGVGYELDAIAAAVVGGTSLMGGYGTAAGTLVGAIFIMALTTLFRLKQIDDYVAMGWKGIIILAAVYLQNLRRR